MKNNGHQNKNIINIVARFEYQLQNLQLECEWILKYKLLYAGIRFEDLKNNGQQNKNIITIGERNEHQRQNLQLEYEWILKQKFYAVKI